MCFPTLEFETRQGPIAMRGTIAICNSASAEGSRRTTYDARALLGGDTTAPTAKGLATLGDVADEIHALCAGAEPALLVFCDVGASRSPRAAGAFLIKHCNWTAAEVIAQLKVEYAQPSIPNGNLLEDSVSMWLTAFEAKEFPDRAQARPKRAATVRAKK